MSLETPRFPNDSVIDLAHEADFWLGSLAVSPSSREVVRGEEREALEPRVMQVLVALYRAKGTVVSRDDLITRCWEGRIVGEDAINRAIWRLRKLAEADSATTFTIETIPRVGYRLIAGQPPATEGEPVARSPETKAKHRAVTAAIIAAAAIAVVAVAAALISWFVPKPASVPAPPVVARVAVLPFDTLTDGPQTRHFADALTDEIVTRLNSNRIQVVSRDDAATLRGTDRDRRVAELGVSLLFDGTVQDDGNTVQVRVHLDDPIRHATLWSGSVDGPADKSDNLQASLAGTIVNVLACSNRALAPAQGLTDPDLLSRYLHACDIFANAGQHSREETSDLLASLREVVAKAPGFAPAHSDLAKFEVYLSPELPPDQAAPLRREGEAEAHKALALDPKSPDAYLALAMLLPQTDWAGREKLLRQGVAGDPDWPITNAFLSQMLSGVGRLQEAIVLMQKAAAADLQNTNWAPFSDRLQCSSGQFEPATSDLLAALKDNRAETDIAGSGYGLRGCLKYARRWADLRALVKTAEGAGGAANRTDPSSPAFDTYLVAYEFGKPADVARARKVALAAPSANTGAITNAIEALTVLGFTDDAFAVANRYTPHGCCDSAGLFFTLTAPLRADPRFMQLAARIGLVDYWRSSGHWPDFCGDPRLPYDCRTEANRIKPAK
jgi:DNA-binding winged helix-turn-helix (wHTH) protein/TolB-like protein